MTTEKLFAHEVSYRCTALKKNELYFTISASSCVLVVWCRKSFGKKIWLFFAGILSIIAGNSPFFLEPIFKDISFRVCILTIFSSAHSIIWWHSDGWFTASQEKHFRAENNTYWLITGPNLPLTVNFIRHIIKYLVWPLSYSNHV